MKGFRVFLFIACLLSAANYCFSQECNTTSDPRTGERVITADYSNEKSGDRYVYFENKRNQTRFSLLWTYPGSWNVIVPKGTLITLKLESGVQVGLYTASEAQAKISVGSFGVFSSYAYEMEVDALALNKLSLSKAIKMELPDLKGGKIEVEDKNYSKAIQKSAKYLSKRLEH